MEEKNNQSVEQQTAPEDKFKIVKGKFKYGKFEDEVGMFMAVFGNEKLRSWNLIMTDDPESQLTPVDGDYIIFKRIFAGNSIKEKKRSYKFKQQVKEKLEEKVQDLITAPSPEIEDFFDQQLHIIAKERIKLEIGIEEVTKEELEKELPQLFHEEQEESTSEPEKEKKVLQCSVLIAPIKGRKISNLSKGDEIVLGLTGPQYQKYKEELAEVISAENKIIGTIQEINYDPEEDLYLFSVYFTADIYGETTLDASDNMKLEIPAVTPEVDPNYYKEMSNLIINSLLIIVVILVIIFLVSSLI